MPVDVGIYNMLGRGVKSVADYDREAMEGQQNMLTIQGQRMKMDEMQRGVQRQRNLLALTSGWRADTTDDQRAAALKNAGYFDEADKLEKTLLERQKTGAQIKKDTAETDSKSFSTAQERYNTYRRTAGALFNDPALSKAKVVAAIGELKAFGGINADIADQLAQQLPEDVPTLKSYLQHAVSTQLKPEEMLTMFSPKYELRDTGGSVQAFQTNPHGGQVGVVPNMAVPKTQSPDSVASNALGWANNRVSRDRLVHEQNQPKGTYDPTRGIVVDTRAGTATPVTMPGGAPLPAAKAGNLSPTMQKELFEADDTVQSGKAVVSILEQAKKLNDTAYSGYGAKTRAMVRSNLPGESAGADATINLDNMMTGQALESLKLVFGGMPTEGERKILLEIQASADKTPGQRKDIIDRAIRAATTRIAFNEKKAKALREGTYLTQGVENDPVQPPAATPAAPAKAKFLGFEGQ